MAWPSLFKLSLARRADIYSKTKRDRKKDQIQRARLRDELEVPWQAESLESRILFDADPIEAAMEDQPSSLNEVPPIVASPTAGYASGFQTVSEARFFPSTDTVNPLPVDVAPLAQLPNPNSTVELTRDGSNQTVSIGRDGITGIQITEPSQTFLVDIPKTTSVGQADTNRGLLNVSLNGVDGDLIELRQLIDGTTDRLVQNAIVVEGTARLEIRVGEDITESLSIVVKSQTLNASIDAVYTPSVAPLVTSSVADQQTGPSPIFAGSFDVFGEVDSIVSGTFVHNDGRESNYALLINNGDRSTILFGRTVSDGGFAAVQEIDVSMVGETVQDIKIVSSENGSSDRLAVLFDRNVAILDTLSARFVSSFSSEGMNLRNINVGDFDSDGSDDLVIITADNVRVITATGDSNASAMSLSQPLTDDRPGDLVNAMVRDGFVYVIRRDGASSFVDTHRTSPGNNRLEFLNSLSTTLDFGADSNITNSSIGEVQLTLNPDIFHVVVQSQESSVVLIGDVIDGSLSPERLTDDRLAPSAARVGEFYDATGNGLPDWVTDELGLTLTRLGNNSETNVNPTFFGGLPAKVRRGTVSAFEAGSFNDDSRMDLLVARRSSQQSSSQRTSRVEIWLGKDVNEYQFEQGSSFNSQLDAIGAGAFVRDGEIDFIALGGGAETAYFSGLGNGQLESSRGVTGYNGVFGTSGDLVIGDFNQDDRLDFASLVAIGTADGGGTDAPYETVLSLSYGLGDGTFLQRFTNVTRFLESGDASGMQLSAVKLADGNILFALAYGDTVPIENATQFRLQVDLFDLKSIEQFADRSKSFTTPNATPVAQWSQVIDSVPVDPSSEQRFNYQIAINSSFESGGADLAVAIATGDEVQIHQLLIPESVLETQGVETLQSTLVDQQSSGSRAIDLDWSSELEPQGTRQLVITTDQLIKIRKINAGQWIDISSPLMADPDTQFTDTDLDGPTVFTGVVPIDDPTGPGSLRRFERSTGFDETISLGATGAQRVLAAEFASGSTTRVVVGSEQTGFRVVDPSQVQASNEVDVRPSAVAAEIDGIAGKDVVSLSSTGRLFYRFADPQDNTLQAARELQSVDPEASISQFAIAQDSIGKLESLVWVENNSIGGNTSKLYKSTFNVATKSFGPASLVSQAARPISLATNKETGEVVAVAQEFGNFKTRVISFLAGRNEIVSDFALSDAPLSAPSNISRIAINEDVLVLVDEINGEASVHARDTNFTLLQRFSTSTQSVVNQTRPELGINGIPGAVQSSRPIDVQLADLNDDGISELIVLNDGANEITIRDGIQLTPIANPSARRLQTGFGAISQTLSLSHSGISFDILDAGLDQNGAKANALLVLQDDQRDFFDDFIDNGELFFENRNEQFAIYHETAGFFDAQPVTFDVQGNVASFAGTDLSGLGVDEFDDLVLSTAFADVRFLQSTGDPALPFDLLPDEPAELPITDGDKRLAIQQTGVDSNGNPTFQFTIAADGASDQLVTANGTNSSDALRDISNQAVDQERLTEVGSIGNQARPVEAVRYIDLNLDGADDLVYTDYVNGRLVIQNGSDGQGFGSERFLTVANGPTVFAVDLGDGSNAEDVAVAVVNTGSRSVSVVYPNDPDRNPLRLEISADDIETLLGDGTTLDEIEITGIQFVDNQGNRDIQLTWERVGARDSVSGNGGGSAVNPGFEQAVVSGILEIPGVGNGLFDDQGIGNAFTAPVGDLINDFSFINGSSYALLGSGVVQRFSGNENLGEIGRFSGTRILNFRFSGSQFLAVGSDSSLEFLNLENDTVVARDLDLSFNLDDFAFLEDPTGGELYVLDNSSGIRTIDLDFLLELENESTNPLDLSILLADIENGQQNDVTSDVALLESNGAEEKSLDDSEIGNSPSSDDVPFFTISAASFDDAVRQVFDAVKELSDLLTDQSIRVSTVMLGWTLDPESSDTTWTVTGFALDTFTPAQIQLWGDWIELTTVIVTHPPQSTVAALGSDNTSEIDASERPVTESLRGWIDWFAGIESGEDDGEEDRSDETNLTIEPRLNTLPKENAAAKSNEGSKRAADEKQ